MAENVNPKLVPVALEESDTTSFERFAQAFYADLIGRSFVPLGGMHDGGAEGYIEPEIFENEGASHFLQVSKQKTFRKKIRDTIDRLRAFGRVPKTLDYISSEIISNLDIEEDKLSDELNCRIRIRDAKYIESHINRSPATVAAFNAHLAPSLDYLLSPGAAHFAPRVSDHVDRTLAVFLRQEVEHRQGRGDLLDRVADSLIIWALSDTDPDKGDFLNRDQILSRIEFALPSSKHYMRGVLDDRLEKLRKKEETQGRQVRFYHKGGLYCLPFETRRLISEENLEDDSLRVEVAAILHERSINCSEEGEVELAPTVVRICQEVLQRIFEKQGLQVALFINGGDQEGEIYANAAQLATEVIDGEHALANSATTLRRLCSRVLRGTFYDSTEAERLYLEKLSRTYVLMLSLKNAPFIVDYFKSISSNFNLYIGTDFLVRALSEYYLEEENQTTGNLFRILRAAGARLVLTEKAVEELATHLRAQIFEFEGTYMHLEGKITLELVEYVDRILIRSYFYSRLSPVTNMRSPSGFRSYINNFVSYDAVRADKADDELARYLITKFGFEYESTEEMREGVDLEEVEKLTKAIVAARGERARHSDKGQLLAENDALQVFAVYAKRKKNKEGSPGNPFGFKTWWLTQDGKVGRASAYVVAQHYGQRFMMRPEFVLNFISLAPSSAEVMASYRSIFPSVLGVRLSNRVPDSMFRSVMRSANEIWAVDEARASAMIVGLTDKLKGDMIKIYDVEWEEAI